MGYTISMLRRLLSEREKDLPLSTIGKLIKIAEERKDIISLGAGELDYTSPPLVIAAAKKALDKGFTHYSPAEGRVELREALSKKLKKENNINVSPEQIIVTVGATEGLLLSLMCSIDPGEGVLLPDPGFLGFKPVVEILNGMPLSVPLKEETRFTYEVEGMEQAIIPEKTRVLILNSPSNPTGQVIKRKELEEIADFAVEYNLLILSDEAYENFVYGVKQVSMGGLNGMGERVVTLHSFSKSFAMPGFRIGYASGPEELIKAMTKVHVFTSVCAPTVSQIAALQALKDRKATSRMVREYEKRGRFLHKRLNEIPGVSCLKPEGAFYLFPNIQSFGMKSLDFAEMLLKKAKVAVVPGTEFGRHGEGFIRVSYATELVKIKQAMDRIERVIKRLAK